MKGLLFLVACVLIVGALASTACMAFSGAIWTTDEAGTVNRNIYDAKWDVYLNGGPQGRHGGLPDGIYYYQVTDPSGGTVLSSEPIDERTIVVIGGWVETPVQLYPFDDTPSAGGEYKAWITLVSDYEANGGAFAPGCTKTDSFKVKRGTIVPQ